MSFADSRSVEKMLLRAVPHASAFVASDLGRYLFRPLEFGIAKATPNFAKDALIRRVAAEPAVLLGAGRALLLQIANHNVAQGVAQFSDFKQHPFRRLLGTMEATYAVVFGSTQVANGVGTRISSIHDHINGPGYRANDPDNLLWVHATLLDTMVQSYTGLVAPLCGRDLDEIYEQMASIAVLFGCARSEQPSNYGAFRTYFDRTVATMQVGDLSVELAHDIVTPKFPELAAVLSAPAVAMMRRMALGSLPERLRDELRFDWDTKEAAQFARATARWKYAFSKTPRPMRVAPGWLQGRYLLHRARHHIHEALSP